MRLFPLALTVILALFAGAEPARATSSVAASWRKAYPNACATLVADVKKCVSCHLDDYSLNPYAESYLAHGESWPATEGDDSDGDGKKNGAEIAACTKPWSKAARGLRLRRMIRALRPLVPTRVPAGTFVAPAQPSPRATGR